MKTYSAKADDVERKWLLIDAKGKNLGRLATSIARRLIGKDKPTFTPHVDTGDFVVVVNASEIEVTGNKRTDKKYYSHSGYPGGLKTITFDKLMDKHPTEALRKAVKGMLPKNILGGEMFSKFKVYAGAEHPHAAQQPEQIEE